LTTAWTYHHPVLVDWPLVGRGDELARIEQRLAGPPSGVALVGAPGVGKTRLAGEVLERARRRGGATAWVQATRSAGSIPFGAFAHLLPADLGGSGPVNMIRIARDAVLRRQPEVGPLVLGVDDAHLLDAASSTLLHRLGQSEGCFVVLTVRSREPVPDAVVNLWKDGPLERIELCPLDIAEVGELVPAVLGSQVDSATLHRLWESSGGNALYLRELVLDGVESGTLRVQHGVWRWSGVSAASPRLADLLAARLGDLSSTERTVLEIVAQAEPLEAAFLDAVTDAPDRTALERRGLLDTLISGRRRTVRLAHPLYAESLRASTPPTARRLMWRQLSELLAAAGARRAGDPLRLATWRLGSGEPIDPAASVAAARMAIGLQDFALAERLARAALQTGGHFEANLALANALIGLGRGLEAETLLAMLEPTATNDERRAQAALRRSDNLYSGLGDGIAARAVLDEALGAVSTTPWRETLVAANARLELFGGDARRAVSMVGDLLERPHLGPDLLVEIWPLAAWGRIVTGPARRARLLRPPHPTRRAASRPPARGARPRPLVAQPLCGGAGRRAVAGRRLVVARHVPAEPAQQARHAPRRRRVHLRVDVARDRSPPARCRSAAGSRRGASRQRPVPPPIGMPR
jgi:AAA ATPase domain